jgi:ADP-ribosyl-[dinitrogen reductase] hydrolase
MRDRIEAGLWGLLIGDAVGVPYEFHPRQDIPPLADIDMWPPAKFDRAHFGVPPGTWSDDGAQALILMSTLLDSPPGGELNIVGFTQGLLAWFDDGFMAVDGRVFDVGLQTVQAIRRLRDGVPALQAGSACDQANGNGSLMRTLPVALWHQLNGSSDAALVETAMLQSMPTHSHLRSRVACAFYGLWAREMLNGATDTEAGWHAAAAKLATVIATMPHAEEAAQELNANICPRVENSKVGGTGYVVDCLHSARWALRQGSYEHVVKAAISLGHDTDTTACVAGGIAGIRDGVSAIPARWLDGLRGKQMVEAILARLPSTP